MADNDVQINNTIEFSEKGLSQVLDKVNELGTSLTNVSNTLEKINKHFDELASKKTTRITSHSTQISSGQGYSSKDIEMLERASKASERLTLSQAKLNEEKAKSRKFDNENAKQILENKTKIAQAQAEKVNLNRDYYKFRSEHPERFARQRGTPAYEMSKALRSTGQTIGSFGGIGGVIGGGLQIGGAALISKWTAASVGIGLVTKGITDLTKAAVTAYGEIESVKTQIGVVTGSDVQASALFNNISEYAVKSPFGVEQVSELAILLRQSGVYASDLMDTLKMLGDTAGGNMEKFKRIANNYAQIVSIGKASMLDMRQFAYAGIPIFEAVSKELGVSQTELRKLISDGKVTADIIEKVFKDLTGINGIFHEATAKGAATLKARLQNLKDTQQLTMASFGESILNIGKTYEHESFALNALSLTESITKALGDSMAVRNIEKNVGIIAKRDNKIASLKALAEQARKNGDYELSDYLEKKISTLENKISPEQDRSYLSASYEAKLDYNKNKKENDARNLKIVDTAGNLGIILSMVGGATPGTLLLEELFKQLVLANVDKAQRLTKPKTIDEKETQAYYESLTEVSQRDMADYISKTAGGSDVTKAIAEMRMEQKESDAYKEKERNEQLKKWEETQNLLREMVKYQKDSSGVIDTSKMSADELLKYIDRGVLNVEKKLTVLSDNPEKVKEDRNELQTNVLNASGLVQQYIRNAGSTGVVLGSKFDRELRDYFANIKYSEKDDTEFIKSYARETGTIIEKLNKKLEKKGLSASETDFLNNLKKIILSAGLRYSADFEMMDYKPEDKSKSKSGSDYTFIPLWKRILGSATGLSPQLITSTASALDAYNTDIAIRNRTSGVLGAMLSQGGNVSRVTDLVKYDPNKRTTLRGDSGYTYQIDWEKTGNAVKDFALKQSASTKVIDSYKTSLEQQRDTYIKLLSEGLTAMETTDINGSKTMTEKQSQKFMQDYSQQLVNAFGETLINAEGQKVFGIDSEGRLLDEEGNVLANQQLKITGNLFSMLEKNLVDIRKEISEAGQMKGMNEILSRMSKNTIDSRIMDRLISNSIGNTEKMYSVKMDSDILTRLLDEEIENRLSVPFVDGGFAGIVEGNFTSKEDVKNASLTNRAVMLQIDSIITEILKKLSTLPSSTSFMSEAELAKASAAQDNLLNLYSTRRKEEPDIYGMKAFDSSVMSMAGLNQGTTIEKMLEIANAGKSKRLNLIDKAQENISTANADSYISQFSDMGVSQEYIDRLENAKGSMTDMLSILEEMKTGWAEVTEEQLRSRIADEAIGIELQKMKQNITETIKQAGKDTFLAPFKTLGECLVTGENASDTLNQNLKKVAGTMLSNIGAAMANAGFNIAASAAMDKNWSMVAAGLALAAAGGFASGFGGALSSAQADEDESDDKSAKLESLRDSLTDLLEQARSDALYYENNLRHKTALGINKSFSDKTVSVHDAVITPSGTVVKTDPKDYLIASKKPQNLVGGSSGGSANVNVVVNNNTNARVSIQQQESSDGTVEITAMIENLVGSYISSGRSDDAFNAREGRLRGRMSVMG